MIITVFICFSFITIAMPFSRDLVCLFSKSNSWIPTIYTRISPSLYLQNNIEALFWQRLITTLSQDYLLISTADSTPYNAPC